MAKNNFNQKLIEAFGEEVGKINQAIDENKDPIARAIVKEMKANIAVGLSPTEGKGRYVAYKSQVESKRIRGGAKAAKSFGSRRLANVARAQANAIAKGYPISVQKKFPNKRLRPVNLFLSGNFLKLLTFQIVPGKTPAIEVGFFDAKAQDMERGHREGANSQGIRPIIPIQGEALSKSVVNAALDLLDLLIARLTKSA